MRPKRVHQVLTIAYREKFPVLLGGGPGVGKTTMCLEAAEAGEYEIMLFHPSISDPTDFKGFPMLDKNGEAGFIPFGELKALTEVKKPTVAIFDDTGHATPAVQAAMMQLLLARKLNSIKISDEVRFVVCTNRVSDKAGANPIIEPFKSRCYAIIDVETNEDDWCEWNLQHGVDARMIAFVRFTSRHGDKNFLNMWKPTTDLTNSPCPRALTNAAAWLPFYDELDPMTRRDVFKGAAGAAFAQAFEAFIRNYDIMPDPNLAIIAPDKVEVPSATEHPDVLCAFFGAVARLSSKKNFSNVVKIAQKSSKEFETLLIKDAVSNDTSVCKTEAFVKWCTDNKNVFV